MIASLGRGNPPFIDQIAPVRRNAARIFERISAFEHCPLGAATVSGFRVDAGRSVDDGGIKDRLPVGRPYGRGLGGGADGAGGAEGQTRAGSARQVENPYVRSALTAGENRYGQARAVGRERRADIAIGLRNRSRLLSVPVRPHQL